VIAAVAAAAVPVSTTTNEKVSVEGRERPHIPTASELQKAAAAENDELDAVADQEKRLPRQ
jgi:hypothetical protein